MAEASREIFVSYSHHDKGWIAALGLNRKPTGTEAAEFWFDDRGIHPGDVWSHEAQKALTRAAAAVLLVSPSFLASESIHEYEIPWIMRRWRAGEISVVFVPIGDITPDEVGRKLDLPQVHNIVSIPAWTNALPRVPVRRDDVREEIVSAVTETKDVQDLRRTLSPNYRLERALGSGAMGRVFRAHDRQLDRTVAVKLLRDAGRGGDFERSMRAAAYASDQTSILSLYAGYLDTYPPHVVRHYSPGETLRELLDRRAQPLARTLVQEFLATIGRAVRHAHAHDAYGLILNPRKVLVSEPNVLTRIAEGHSEQGIPASLYPEFSATLISTIADLDPSTPRVTRADLVRAWAHVVGPGIRYLKEKTEAIELLRFRC